MTAPASPLRELLVKWRAASVGDWHSHYRLAADELEAALAAADASRVHRSQTMTVKACDGCGALSPHTVFGWLIEADKFYWDGHYPDSRGFTHDVSRAVRFARHEDAEIVKHWLLRDHAFALRTTQHGWDN